MKSQKPIFAARGRHSWLLPKATTSLKSQKPIFAAGGRHIYLWPEATSLSKSHVPAEIGTMVTINLIEVMHTKNRAMFYGIEHDKTIQY